MGKNLDQELAEAADLDGEAKAPPVDDGGMAVPRRTAAKPHRNLGMLIVLLAMAATIAGLFLWAVPEGGGAYSRKLAEVVANAEDLEGRRVRIQGELVPGTLVVREKPCEFRFVVREYVDDAANKDARKTVEIRYASCAVPDSFRDVPQGGVEVTVEGSIVKDGYFEATSVMAKCASKQGYNPETHEVSKGPVDVIEAKPIN